MKHRKTKKYQKKKKGGTKFHNYQSMYPSTGPRFGGFNFLNPIHQNGGNSSYPNGLVGSPYNNPNNLPGVNGIPGSANYYKHNDYNTDVQTAGLKYTGANTPFKGGKSRKRRFRSRSKSRGGAFSNSLAQDLVNSGRSVGFGFSSAYNGLLGKTPPVNPFPLAGQFAKPLLKP